MDQPSEISPVIYSRRQRIVRMILVLAVLYLVVAYLIIPWVTMFYAHRHPSFDGNPRLTKTGDDHPGDPLNVGLIGEKEHIEALMHAAKWEPAAKLGLKSDVKIGVDTILSRPDEEAPVSNLFLFGRKEDFAFEQPVGDNPRQRNHVRFWKMDATDDQGRPMWIGAASYDEHVGLSHTTGQVTHHISGDVDKERDHLFDDLKKSSKLTDFYIVNGFHTQLEGRNGGGDPWHTDGDLYVGIITLEENAPAAR